jgi:hypothetical protein
VSKRFFSPWQRQQIMTVEGRVTPCKVTG